jgi:hypothetical protein
MGKVLGRKGKKWTSKDRLRQLIIRLKHNRHEKEKGTGSFGCGSDCTAARPTRVVCGGYAPVWRAGNEQTR